MRTGVIKTSTVCLESNRCLQRHSQHESLRNTGPKARIGYCQATQTGTRAERRSCRKTASNHARMRDSTEWTIHVHCPNLRSPSIRAKTRVEKHRARVYEVETRNEGQRPPAPKSQLSLRPKARKAGTLTAKAGPGASRPDRLHPLVWTDQRFLSISVHSKQLLHQKCRPSKDAFANTTGICLQNDRKPETRDNF